MRRPYFCNNRYAVFCDVGIGIVLSETSDCLVNRDNNGSISLVSSPLTLKFVLGHSCSISSEDSVGGGRETEAETDVTEQITNRR